MSNELNDKTKEIFMSVYESKSMGEALGKMDDLQYKIVQDERIDDDNKHKDNDEERSLVSKTQRNSSYSLLESWLKKCSLRSKAHTDASVKCGIMYYLISLPTIILGGTATGLAFWATSDENGTSHQVRVMVAGLSATSTMFASLTGLFRFNETGYQHKMAAGMYSQLCRKIEVNVFSPSPMTSINGLQTLLAEISVQFSNTIAFSPQINIQ